MKGTAARICIRGKCRLCCNVCEGSDDSGTAQTLVVDRVAVALSTAFDDERLGVAAVEPVDSAAFVESMMALAPGAVPAEAAVRTDAAAFVPAKIGVGTIAGHRVQFVEST